MKARRRGLLAALRYMSLAAQDLQGGVRAPDEIEPCQRWIRQVEREIAGLLREHPKRPSNPSDPQFPK